METLTSAPVILTDEERALVLELLKREGSNLPVQIHHARTGKFRDLLKRRLRATTDLLNRLENQ